MKRSDGIVKELIREMQLSIKKKMLPHQRVHETEKEIDGTQCMSILDER